MSNVILAGREIFAGRICTITLKLVADSDRKIYQSFLEGERLVCPKCGTKLSAEKLAHNFNPIIKISDPLTANPIMAMAEPIVECMCGHQLELSMIDYTAFPSVVEFLKALQAKYQAKKVKG